MTTSSFPIRVEDWPAVARLFDEGSALEAEALAAFLARLDEQQPSLSNQVRALLASGAERETGDWLDRGPHLAGPDLAHLGEAEGLRVGDTVGRYRLVSPCGAGGMGEVWQAEALEGPARQLALKIPLWHRPGSASAERFAREGRILATLDHPNIARLFDAGTSSDGTPYLAMEWVEGRPLIEFCDAKRLDLAARLRLFLQVLDAVAYAHARLVLHRDLKPANMLVTHDGQVKLLDFGIAKLLDEGQPADATELTRAAGRIMTTAYAAPEQLRGEALTTAADLYSLGVVLFQLLSGHRPYAPRLNTPAQLEAAIVDGRLVRATDAATDADALARGVTRPALARQLRGDLGAVLDKALQLEPAQRYASGKALAEDLTRHLRGHPVLAAPTTAWRRAWKFTRRHRLGVAAAALAVCSLVGVTVAAVWQAREAQAQRAKAETSLEASDSFAIFLGDVLLTDALAAGSKEAMLPVVTGAERIARGEFADDPATLARVLNALSGPYADSGEPEKAAKLIEEARSLTQDRNQLQSMACSLGYMYYLMGRRDQALTLLSHVADDRDAVPVSRSVCSYRRAQALAGGGDIEGALRAADDATRYWQSMKRPMHQFESMLPMLKAGLLMNTPRVAEADALFEQAAESSRRLGRDQGMHFATLMNDWGVANFIAGQLSAAQTRHDEAVALNRQNAGPRGVWPIFLLNAAGDRLEAGLYDQALSLYDQALVAARAYQNTGTAASAQCLGAVALQRTGQSGEAQARLTAGRAEKLGESRADRAATENCTSAAAQLALARGDAAAALHDLDGLLAAPTLRAATRSNLLQWRARAQLALGDTSAAGADAEAALKISRQLQGTQPQSFRTALALDALARQQSATHQPEAILTRREANNALAASVAPTHWLRQ